VAGLAASPLPGPAGNVEYFCWFRADASEIDPDAVANVVAVGPQ
jgi:23S rRNA (cytidine1920-2'-O)/16S rRNA (cytidine1409-2'-O)-methyltransferase